MRTKDLISGLFWLGIAAIIIWQALELNLGDYRSPGPGFLPLGVGLGMTVICLVMIIRAIFSGTRSWPKLRISKSAFSRIGFVMAGLLLYAIFFPYLGFPLTTFFFLLIIFRSTGSQDWLKSTLLAGTATVFAYFLFSVFLSCELPRGILGI